jgi:hypothetical protein
MGTAQKFPYFPSGESCHEFIGKNYAYYYIEWAESTAGSPQIDLSRPFDSITRAELAIRAIDSRARNAREIELALKYSF